MIGELGPEVNRPGQSEDSRESFTGPDVKAPGWAGFERLRASLRVEFAANEPDPFAPAGSPCPVWCVHGHADGSVAHVVEASQGRRVHESDALRVPVKLLRGVRELDGSVRLGHVAVSLRTSAASARPNGLAWVDVDVVQAYGRDRMRDWRAASLTPAEALSLAEALLVAARLADSDSEFEEAAK